MGTGEQARRVTGRAGPVTDRARRAAERTRRSTLRLAQAGAEQARRRLGRFPRVRRAGALAMERLAFALRSRRSAPAADGMYGAGYYGQGRNPQHRDGRSGYAVYDRSSSLANVQAYLLWRFFGPRRSLDVGCAVGFVVEALAELGVDAQGCDVSDWAVANAAPGAAGRLGVVDLERDLPFPAAHFDVISAFEVLEHLEPAAVPGALARLRAVANGWLVATIPSIGPNRNGPHGTLGGKVAEPRLAHYEALGPGYDGPVPFADLMRDRDGEPIQGHLVVASFAWWERQFADAGFERCDEMERRVNPVVARFNQAVAWNLFVARVPGTPLGPDDLHDRATTSALERRWGIDTLEPDGHTDNVVRAAGGDQAVVAVRAELEAARAG